MHALDWTGRWLLPLLLTLLVVRLWLVPLQNSFWIDETATIFVAQHGSNHRSLNGVAPQVWQSWYYRVIRLWGALFGFSEVATRIPSILAMIAFLALVARLSTRLIDPESGWFAVFACLALPDINYQAANARPYALGMCFFATGLLSLVLARFRRLARRTAVHHLRSVGLVHSPDVLAVLLGVCAVRHGSRGARPNSSQLATRSAGLFALGWCGPARARSDRPPVTGSPRARVRSAAIAR